MTSFIQQAMILAAGFGKRLRPLTDTIPKPLIPINNTTCLDEVIKRLKEMGVKKIVVNTHHLAPQIHRHLSTYQGILISYEAKILETGGGIAKALPHFGDQPFFCINADIWWWDSAELALRKLTKAWDKETMDILLMVTPKKKTIGYQKLGDYHLAEDYRLNLPYPNTESEYVYSGIQILSSTVFYKSALWPNHTAFSLTEIFSEAEQRKRLYGYVHDGLWADIGNHQGLEEARKILEQSDIDDL
jgi:MurNAc alpha-1-phosphate uridylyltransferase